MKFYAVRTGRNTGIYSTWAECKEQVHGYSGAAFKGFETAEEAEDYLQKTDDGTEVDDSLPHVYIDGSYSKKGPCYGWGGFIDHEGQKHILQGTGDNETYITERNIAGELLGTLQALTMCLEMGIPAVNIFFDYSGIEKYISGEWKTKTPLAQYYKSETERLQEGVTPHYIKVKGHEGIAGNEIADLLAKEAVGAKLKKKDLQALEQFRHTGRLIF